MPHLPALDQTTLGAELAAVVTAVWFEIDHRDGSGVSAFFTPDAELRLGERTFRGRAEIDALYATRAARGPRVSRHLACNLHVVSAGYGEPPRATAVSSLLLFAQDGEPPRSTVTPAMVGDVTDEFEWHDGTWLIRSRHLSLLFTAPELDLAVPVR
ncbi:nuclear transport factor 2 family protein [Streptomyces sp. NPDC047081]|uniref:nuclear transport factor 2 family protein n=1 Tax=Streptomyces sp. NPDC047081 TaxID=3154706 RepID=UPI0033F1D5B5